jgi:hypothetical protein
MGRFERTFPLPSKTIANGFDPMTTAPGSVPSLARSLVTLLGRDPNVVAVFDAGEEENGCPYLVTELLEGETLGERLRKGALAPTAAVEAALGIAIARSNAASPGPEISATNVKAKGRISRSSVASPSSCVNRRRRAGNDGW